MTKTQNWIEEKKEEFVRKILNDWPRAFQQWDFSDAETIWSFIELLLQEQKEEILKDLEKKKILPITYDEIRNKTKEEMIKKVERMKKICNPFYNQALSDVIKEIRA